MSASPNDFDEFVKRRKAASNAFVDGNFAALGQVPVPVSPATLFGPERGCIKGAEQVNAASAKGATHFEAGSTNTPELLHQGASGPLGYWVGIQRCVARIGRPR